MLISVFGEIPKEVFTNEVFKALSDPTRREILRFLRDREHTAGELADRFPLSKSTLSGHFSVLKNADLIEQDKRGTTIFYRLNTTVFQEMLGHIFDVFGAAEQNAVAPNKITPNKINTGQINTGQTSRKGDL
jgi:ArsR family transcriptional regulator, arsenate/arsenite/antimonite-responsive transcriptional repressor